MKMFWGWGALAQDKAAGSSCFSRVRWSIWWMLEAVDGSGCFVRRRRCWSKAATSVLVLRLEWDAQLLGFVTCIDNDYPPVLVFVELFGCLVLVLSVACCLLLIARSSVTIAYDDGGLVARASILGNCRPWHVTIHLHHLPPVHHSTSSLVIVVYKKSSRRTMK